MHKLKTAPLCVQSRQRTLPEHRYLLQGRTEEGILETGEFSASKLELGREKGLRGKYGLGWVGKIWEGFGQTDIRDSSGRHLFCKATDANSLSHHICIVFLHQPILDI